MPNNLYQQLNGNNSQNRSLVDRFIEFKNSFQGDPRQIVEQLLQSGKMSQSQYNQLRQMASEFQKLLPKF